MALIQNHIKLLNYESLKYRLKLQSQALEKQIANSGIPEGPIFNDDVSLINDHFYFCLTKSCRSLKAIKSLYEKHFFEDSLTVLRSVYEAYLSLRYMLNTQDDKNLDYLVLNPIGIQLGVLEFDEKQNGKVDLSTLVNTNTGEKIDHKIVGPSKLAKNTGFDLDNVIHHQLYSYLCNYSHVNMGTFSHYIEATYAENFQQNLSLTRMRMYY